MPIKHHPYTGMILRCDFSGLKPPEMVKIRPVLVISPRPERLSKKTCIVVALSTTPPERIEKYHLKIELPSKLPDNLSRECWLKGDMVYSLSFERMDLYRYARDHEGKRKYYYDRVSADIIQKARKAVAYAIGVPYVE